MSRRPSTSLVRPEGCSPYSSSAHVLSPVAPVTGFYWWGGRRNRWLQGAESPVPSARPRAWTSSAVWWPRAGQGGSASVMPGALSPASWRPRPRPSPCPHDPRGAQVSVATVAWGHQCALLILGWERPVHGPPAAVPPRLGPAHRVQHRQSHAVRLHFWARAWLGVEVKVQLDSVYSEPGSRLEVKLGDRVRGGSGSGAT